MTLSAWEQQALDSIQDGLTSSDPRLATLLATFTRLVSDEEMPVRENIRERSRRGIRPVRPRLAPQQAAFWVYLGITAVLIVTVLILSRGDGRSACPSVWAVPCASSAHAHNAKSSAP